MVIEILLALSMWPGGDPATGIPVAADKHDLLSQFQLPGVADVGAKQRFDLSTNDDVRVWIEPERPAQEFAVLDRRPICTIRVLEADPSLDRAFTRSASGVGPRMVRPSGCAVALENR